jgi:endonuclease/exonuclease/phosphatase (EEP) superfamily protein YafD
VVKLPAVFQIDHILGRGVCFWRGAVLRAGGSDHYPVTAELQLGACSAEPSPTPTHID